MNFDIHWISDDRTPLCGTDEPYIGVSKGHSQVDCMKCLMIFEETRARILKAVSNN